MNVITSEGLNRYTESRLDVMTKPNESSYANKTVKETDATLSCYMDKGHAFIRLTNPQRNIDIYRGKYPKTEYREQYFQKQQHNLKNAAKIAAVSHYTPKLSSSKSYGLKSGSSVGSSVGYALGHVAQSTAFVCLDEKTHYSCDSMIVDENEIYGMEGCEKIPFVAFQIDQAAADNVEKHLTKERIEGYSMIRANCVDFTQEVFEVAGLVGYFYDYFPIGSVGYGVAPIYANVKILAPKVVKFIRSTVNSMLDNSAEVKYGQTLEEAVLSGALKISICFLKNKLN